MAIGIVGGIVFIYIQHITLIDCAYEVNGIWHARSTKSILYKLYIYFFALIFYLGTIGAYAYFVLAYGLPQRCTLNLALTGFNAGITMLLAICSAFSPTLRKKELWLPGAVTSAFVAFLTWTALTSQPKTISSDIPWQKSTRSNKQNTSSHPILIVANQLDRLLSDPFVDDLKDPSTAVTQPPTHNRQGSIMINQCLPSGPATVGEHLGKDLFTLLGLGVVLAWFLYTSFRATLQARRLGIRTKREKLKRHLFAIAEHPEVVDDNEELNAASTPTKQLNRKEVKRQEQALNLLANVVSELPNPKVFRRPSTRQPRQRPALKFNRDNKPITGTPKDQTDAPLKAPVDASVQTSLRFSSSVPDLTVVLRQLNSRAHGDIRRLDWFKDPLDQPDAHKTSTPQQQQMNKPLSHTNDKNPHDKLTENQLEPLFNQLHSRERRTRTRRKDTRRVPSKLVRRKGLDKITDEEEKETNTALILSHLAPDGLPDKFGAQPTSMNGHLTGAVKKLHVENGRPTIVPFSKRPILQTRVRRFSEVAFDPGLDDSTLTRSPYHLRYQLARSASEVLVSRRGSRLLQSQPELAASFAFLGPLMKESSPRDRYTVYNEAIAAVYPYSWFHFIYALATLYLMAQLTNWYNPHISGVSTLYGSWANMWMKLASSWLALLLYAWTIACPRFCAGRKLGDTPLTPRTAVSAV